MNPDLDHAHKFQEFLKSEGINTDLTQNNEGIFLYPRSHLLEDRMKELCSDYQSISKRILGVCFWYLKWA